MIAKKTSLAIAVLSAFLAGNLFAHGGSGSRGEVLSSQEYRQRKLDNIDHSKRKIERRLQKQDLTPTQRTKLERKLEKLNKKEEALK